MSEPFRFCVFYTNGMACGGCGYSFSPGDPYVLRDLDTGEVQVVRDGGVYEPVCVGCGALDSDSKGEG